MKKACRKVLSVFLAVIMSVSCAPMLQFMGEDIFITANAAAEKVTNGNRIGVLNNFTTGWDEVSQSYGKIIEIVFDSVEYEVADNAGLSYSYIDALVGKDVLVRFYNGAVTSVEDVKNQKTDVSANIEPVTFSYAGKSDWWIHKYVKLSGSVSNRKKADSWSAADKKALEEYLALNGICTYEDVVIELRSENADIVHFGKGSAYTAVSVADVFSPGQEVALPEVKIFVNTECELQGGEEETLVNYSLVSGDGTIIASGNFPVNVINTDYPEELDFVELPDNFFDLLERRLDEYNPGGLYSKEPLESLFTAVKMNKSIKELKAINESVKMLKVAIDVNNMICAVKIDGIVYAAGDTYLEKLFDAIEEDAGKLAGYTDKAINDIFESEDFEKYLEWYQKNYGYELGYYTRGGSHCPTDIRVTDYEGNTALTIIDNEVTVYDELVYAYVNDKEEKTFYLPSNIDYTVEITATGDGTMDYMVSSVTPGGAERVITYEDIVISEGESYTGLITNEKYEAADTYNLVTDKGETVVYTYDSLPPVKSDIADVVIAEELFENLPRETVDLVAEAMFSMKSTVDVSECSIELGDAVALFSAVSKYYPVEYSLLVNGDFTYTVVYSKADNKIKSLKFDYGQDADLSDYQSKVSAVKQQISTVVKNTEGMDEFEKALYLHDYVVLNCRYDTELLEILETEGTLTGKIRSERYSEYSVLVNGTGICGSYALAYRALMNSAGMECIYLSSEEMSHAWNMVKIDGKWYHVDCCWDDPVPDREGRARRTYFLRTDKEIMTLDHFSWTPGQYKASDGKYSSMPRLYDTDQKYDYENNCWYYLTSDGIYKTDKYGNKKEKVAQSVSADAIACDAGKIYYSEGLFIYEYNYESEKWAPVYYLSDDESGYYEDAYIVNFFTDGENISLYKHIQEYNYDTYEYEVKTVYAESKLKRAFFEAIKGITISASELETELFDSEYLYASLISEYDTYDLDIQWSSSDENIATVSQWGTVTGCNKGTAVITASFMDYSASCKVTVTGDEYAGSCGSKITWSFDTDSKVLTLTGSGSIPNYTSSSAPWYSFRKEIKEIVIGSGITSVGDYAFYHCDSAEKITIPEGVTIINDYAFSYCDAIKGITLPSTLRTIYFNAFEWCGSLESINIPYGVDIIHNFVFRGCSSLKTVTLPETVVQLAQGSFAHCISLENINLPSKLTIIGQQAFFCCESLKTLHIPASVTTMASNSFQDCDGMEKFTVDPESTYLSVDEYGALFNKKKTNLASYPSGSKATSYTLPSTVTALNYYAFENAVNLESVVLPEGLTTVRMSAFRGCTSLKRVTVPGTVTSISDRMFEGCTALEEVIIGEGVTALGNYMFQDCSSLKTVSLPESLTGIGSYTFFGCSSLRNIIFPTALNTIGSSAFGSCENLSHVAFRCSEEESSSVTVGSYNNGLSNAPYVHYSFKDSDVIESEGTLPTCTQTGVSEGIYCTVCEGTLTGDIIEAKGHSHKITEKNEGSCTQAPYDVYTCDCGDSHTVYSSVLKGHKYETEVIAPTCKKAGYSINTCSVCGEESVSDFTSPTGHKLFIRKDKDYCEGHGTYEYYCSYCEYTEYVTADSSALETKTVTEEPTCIEGGSIREVCLVCDATVRTEILSATGHTYSEDWTVDREATATEKGIRSRHCCFCDARTDITEFDFTGCLHTDISVTNRKEATCSEDGYTGDTVCSCGVVVSYGEIIPATGEHTGGTATCKDRKVCTVCGEAYGETDSSKHTGGTATCKDKKVCDVCGEAYADKNPANHTGGVSVVGAVDATAEKDGYTGDKYCVGCNEKIATGEIIPATGTEEPEEPVEPEDPVTPEDPSENCPCNCHKSGFSGLIWKILRFFYKIFGMNKVCSCGAAHY